MAFQFVFYVLLVAVGVRFAPTPGAVVVLALASSVAALCADLFLVPERAQRGRLMGAFVLVAPWLTFDARGWWGRLWTSWEERNPHLMDRWPWPETFDRALPGILRSVGASVVVGIIALLAWWISGRIEWRDHTGKLRAASLVGALGTTLAMALLASHGRGLPTLVEYRAGLRPVAPRFVVGRERPCSSGSWTRNEARWTSARRAGRARECKSGWPPFLQ